MERHRLVSVAVVFAVVLLAALTLAISPESKARASSTGNGDLVGGCPKLKPESLPPAALSGATRAALSEAPGLYQRMNTHGRYAESAYRGMSAPVNGFYKNVCPHRLQYGKLLQKRSVQVDMIFPHYMQSASLSQHWVFVARFDGEYRVWGVYR